jgi:hypothetical protein
MAKQMRFIHAEVSMTMQEAIEWLSDDITAARVWRAAWLARVSIKQLVDELLRRNIIDAKGARFIQKLSGSEYEVQP